MVPLESEFGWNRAVISAAVAINIALFGLIGPFAASVMDRWGLRRVVLAGARAAGRVRGAHHADAAPMAADAALGRAGRHGHRRHVDGAGRRRRDALVRRSAAGSCSAPCRQPTPPDSWSSCRCSRASSSIAAGAAATLVVAAAAAVVFVIVLAVHARPAERPRAASLRADAPDAAPEPGRRRWRHSRRSATPRARGVLGAGGDFLRVRREHQRPHRHALDRRVSRLRHFGGPLGPAAGADGHLRHPRHDGVGLAHRSLLEPPPAVRVLHAARAVAAVPAV